MELLTAVLDTLSYFNVFYYPLKREEIWRFMPVKCDAPALDDCLGTLVTSGVIFHVDGYYSLVEGYAVVEQRIKGNKLGRKKLKTAMLIAGFLNAFPFVDGVCVSGSLSKEYATRYSDLDYFIITAPGRMWTARNIMHAFRKLTFIFSAQRLFCMNYFVSSSHTEIEEKDIFRAIELSTLKCAYNSEGIDSLVSSNKKWVNELLPNDSLDRITAGKRYKKGIVAKGIEWLINRAGGDQIEAFCYRTTLERWIKKWSRQHYDIEKCLKSAGEHFNTPVNYPEHLPDLVLDKYKSNRRIARWRYQQALMH